MQNASRIWTVMLLLAGCSSADEAPPAAPSPPLPPDGVDASAPEPEPLCSEEDVLGGLRALPGMTRVDETPCGKYVQPGATCFSFSFAQKLDHSSDASDVFSQEGAIIHRGCDAPVTVSDDGYGLRLFEREPGMPFGANSVLLEHRFQGNSLPPGSQRKWETLSIENGAADLHDVIQSLKPFYTSRWVSTGASKGGITAVYHRFFYPNDVDGTVAYVAPASRERHDPAYQAYFASGVFPAECLANVRDFQTGALTRRKSPSLALLTTELGVPESQASDTLEYLLASYDWGFWQYDGDCASVPGPNDSDEKHIAYLRAYITRQQATGPAPANERVSNAALAYEWSWQQGFALQLGPHMTSLVSTNISDMLLVENQWAQAMPGVRLPAYDGSVTTKVRAWVRTSAERMMLIYGTLDPWSGGALDAPTGPGSSRHFVPKGNHGAAIAQLVGSERQRALDSLQAMYAPSAARMSPTQVQNTLTHMRLARLHDLQLEHDAARLSKSTVSLQTLSR